MNYIAHKRNESDKEEQSIKEHLVNTAKYCSRFAEPLGLKEYAYMAGMLHDIGKYSSLFQKRINGDSSIKVEHSSSGAKVAFKNRLIMATFAIAGHHGGLPDLGDKSATGDGGTMFDKINRPVEDFSQWKVDQPDFQNYLVKEPNFKNKLECSFLTRMLFSCLVDGDYLDTEDFMSNGTVIRSSYEPIKNLLLKLEKYISSWKNPTGELNKLRCKILDECIQSGKTSKESMFTLTVPTGGGKTVSSLAFALNYAVKNNKSRIIYVVPYTSIIEQNSKVFQEILGKENVLEHHSNVSINTENEDYSRKALATENWDAPVVVTTAVQFFESLFSNKTSKCRKLHNIANSVIIFDEAQMLPLKYLDPCVSSIYMLTQRANATAVLCTATQPNLEGFFKKYSQDKNYSIKEISPFGNELTEKFLRTTFKYDGKVQDDELVQRLLENKQVLCIVNKKAHAQKLFNCLDGQDGNFHLSTYMYPNHRKRVINEIKERLNSGKTCRVISTSLIEAGVDIDFPTLYRAIAGLDSILQAGGRCNREGKRKPQESIVHIFDTDEKISFQQVNISVTEEVLEKYPDKVYLPEAISMYFERLYYFKNADKSGSAFDVNKINEKQSAFMFETVAEDFKLIDNDTKTLYIETKDNSKDIELLRKGFYSKELFRRLQGYSLNLYDEEFKKLDEASMVDEHSVLTNKDCYDEKIGIIIPDSQLGSGIIF